MEITRAQYEALEIAYGRKVKVTFGSDAAPHVTLELVPLGQAARDGDDLAIGIGVSDSSAIAALYATIPTYGNETEHMGIGLASLEDNDASDSFWRVFANDTGFIAFEALDSIDALIAVTAFLARTRT